MPWVELDGAVNVRDVGGLPTTDGAQTVLNRLLRGDNLQGLSAADIEKLTQKHGLTTVVDLRSEFERASEGPAPLNGVPVVRHLHYSIVPEVGGSGEVVAAALLARREADTRRYPADRWCGHYLGYLEERPEQVTGAVQSIARSEGAVLVHCAAGKDRTGIIVALALAAVGVTPEAIVADYAATGERAEAIFRRLLASPTYHHDVSRMTVEEQMPKPETMDAFLGQLDKRYGGAASWLASHGFTDEDQALLRARLTLPG
jgi:protein-tyrosine phosphatase